MSGQPSRLRRQRRPQGEADLVPQMPAFALTSTIGCPVMKELVPARRANVSKLRSPKLETGRNELLTRNRSSRPSDRSRRTPRAWSTTRPRARFGGFSVKVGTPLELTPLFVELVGARSPPLPRVADVDVEQAVGVDIGESHAGCQYPLPTPRMSVTRRKRNFPRSNTGGCRRVRREHELG